MDYAHERFGLSQKGTYSEEGTYFEEGTYSTYSGEGEAKRENKSEEKLQVRERRTSDVAILNPFLDDRCVRQPAADLQKSALTLSSRMKVLFMFTVLFGGRVKTAVCSALSTKLQCSCFV